MTRTRPAWLRRLPLILLALAGLAGLWLWGDRLGPETLRDQREALETLRQSRPVATAGLFVAGYATLVALSLPGALLATLTGGLLFGLFPGALLNVAAASLGATTVFLAVRLGLGRGLAARLDAAGGAAGRIAAGLRANEVPVLLSMRLIPVIPFALANLIPAVLGVAAWRFVWTTVVGIIPGTVVYTWVGAGLGEVFARGGSPNLGLILEPQVLAPLLALTGLALAPVLWRVWRGG